MSVYDKAMYRSRKEYHKDYYQRNKAKILKQAHEKYKAKKEHEKRQQAQEHEAIKAEVCSGYCKYTGQLSKADMELKCESCPLGKL